MIPPATRFRGDARSVVAVIAALLVLCGVAFGAHRLVLTRFGAPTHLRAGNATLVDGLPAIENREITDPTDARRWSALATLVGASVLAASLRWRGVDEERRLAGSRVAIVDRGRGPPLHSS